MRYIYIKPDIPELEDMEFWTPLAERIVDDILPAWMNAREGVEQKWMECDRGYLCERVLPPLEGFDYINTSPFGTASIHNGVNSYCIRLALGIMDEKDQWLSILGRKGEDPAVTNAVKAEQSWMHRYGDTRKYYTRGLKQMVVRGITHWWMQWDTEVVYVPIGTKKGRNRLARILRADGYDPSVAKQVKMVRKPVMKFNGPVFSVVDAYDVILDPEADIVQDRRKSYIIRKYMRPHRLKATDAYEEPIYSNIDKLEATTAHQQYNEEKDTNRRIRSAYVMGVDSHSADNVSAKVIPTYTLFAPYLEYEGYEFYDTFFTVAKSANNKPVLIRIEENPSVNGQDLLVTDTFLDWFTEAAYGIGAVQTVLPTWHRQNFFDAVQDNAVAAAQFPSLLYAAGVFKDDEIRLGPAQLNEITMSAAGMEVLRPAVNTASGAQIGFQELAFLKQEIGDVFEVNGGYAQGRGLTAGSRETATSVNYRASNQSNSVSEQREKFGTSLQKMCQWAYDTKQEVAEPEQNENGEEVITFNKIGRSGQLIPDEIIYDQWKRPRTVEILGYHGALNQQQKIDNKVNFIGTLGQMAQFLPNAPTVAQDLVKSLSEDLEIEIVPEGWMPPEQIAANNPEVMKMSLQALMQNPGMAAQILTEMGMQGGPEDGQPGGAPGQGGQGGGGQPQPQGGGGPPR